MSEAKAAQATVVSVGAGGNLASWARHHRTVAVDSLRRLLASWVNSLLTWLVIGIALALPAMMYVLLGNVSSVSAGFGGKPRVTLFLVESGVSAGERLRAEIAALAEVTDVRYISAAEALDDFEQRSEFEGVLETLDENPLPAVIVVTPVADHVEALVDRFGADERIDSVLVDLAWVERLLLLVRLAESIVSWMALFFALGVFLITGNTIRLAIESRRTEIEVVKLVGGTDAFVRRPFLYLGFWYGAGGALAAVLLVELSLLWLHGPIEAVMGAYGSAFAVTGLGVPGALTLFAAGIVLGVAGAWLAVNRHLSQIEPG
tara:strand:+ start:817 stop:1770 length:954 start_codon:yes stop_codon:yes gene_type:complete